MILAALLDRLQAVAASGDGFVARCPGHEDQRASLSVTDREGKLLLHCFAGCSAESIVAALGLTLADLFTEDMPAPLPPPRRTRAKPAKVVATYPYRDEGGELMYEAVRFDPKDFRPRVPNGHGGWTWTLKDVRRVLYRLPELRTGRRDA